MSSPDSTNTNCTGKSPCYLYVCGNLGFSLLKAIGVSNKIDATTFNADILSRNWVPSVFGVLISKSWHICLWSFIIVCQQTLENTTRKYPDLIIHIHIDVTLQLTKPFSYIDGICFGCKYQIHPFVFNPLNYGIRTSSWTPCLLVPLGTSL